jgi:hypothetical protein
MLFPNHPAYAEIRTGMGFAPGARNFSGYAHGAHLGDDSHHLGYSSGAFHLGYEPGAHALGSMSDAIKNAAIDDNIDTSDIDLLDSLGATDQDMTNLINGNTTLSALYAKYGVTISTPATGISVPPAQVSTAQVPPGSTILYTVKVNTPPLTSAQNIIDAISPELPAHGMSKMTSQVSQSGNISGPAQFSLSVMDSIGHALKSDAQSVLDGLIENFLGSGNLQLQSTVTVVSPGITASGQPGASLTSDPIAWLEDNALYIGGGIAVLVLLNNFTGGKRR